MKENQSNLPTGITTTNSLNNLMETIQSKKETGEVIDTDFNDEDQIQRNKRIGCHRKGCIDGYIMTENQTFDYCLCYKIEKMRVRLVKARIPEEYHLLQKVNTDGLRSSQNMYASELINMKNIDINEMLDKYNNNINSIRNEGWNMILEGPTGSGKTTAACICAKSAIKKGFSVLFIELQDLRKLWTGEKLSETLENVKRNMNTVDFLILDDFGQEFLSERSDHQITEFELLIRQRVSKKLCTIYTTNGRKEDIRNRYGDRISSLLNKRMVHVIMHRELDMREDKELPSFLLD